MPGNWMDWAKLIGTFIGAAIIASVAGYQFYGRIVRPLIKRFEPIVSEITGPGNEPGLRKLVEDVGTIASAGVVAANNAGASVNALRVDVQQMSRDHGQLRRDVDAVLGDVESLRTEFRTSAKDQGQRIGEVEKDFRELRGVVTTVKEIQDARGCAVALQHTHGVAEGSQGHTSSGADVVEIPAPAPPAGTVLPIRQSSKGQGL